MATITKIKNKSGALSYRAQVRVKRGGRLVHAEARTFPQLKLAEDWASRLEKQLALDDGVEKRKIGNRSIGDYIGLYVQRSNELKPMGATKRSVYRILCDSPISDVPVMELTPAHIIKHCQERGRLGAKPQTVMQDIIYLGVALGAGSALLGLPVTRKAVDEALPLLWANNLVRKSSERERRLMPGEFERLMVFGAKREAMPNAFVPIRELVRFAIATTMRAGEITSILKSDVDRSKRTVLIRDRKDPKNKFGNNQRVPLLGEAWKIVEQRLSEEPVNEPRIFPYHEDSIGNAFRLTVLEAEIQDLRFHDLRHEGISRLFELGYQIQEVAIVSGHKDWKSLKRYTNLHAHDLHRDPLLPTQTPPVEGRTDRR
ncbi:site-specific integrase [Silvimonas sp.]|uniref:site-specific integrase n=1 Tax=Silvimonas sp. TaxID=2650811 RepID=UPI00284709BE|nr:site-specific integrase [Silvimonas sp.]MDR3427015.1 site-specific integrase [Silvimonas sp.]